MNTTTLHLRSRLVRANQRMLRVATGSCQRLLDGKLVIEDAQAHSETIDAYHEAAGVAQDAIRLLELPRRSSAPRKKNNDGTSQE